MPDTSPARGSSGATGRPKRPRRTPEGITSAYDDAISKQVEHNRNRQLREAVRGGLIFHGKSVATLVLFPWLVYFLVAMTWMLALARIPTVAYVVALVGFMFSGLFILVSQRTTRGSMYLYLGILGIVSTVFGAITGTCISDHHMQQYWSPVVRPKYANVEPASPAAAFRDGGRLNFVTGVRVDVQKSVGWKNLEDGKTYCVAPIVGDSQDNHVNVWAAGVNCCGHRGVFTCDDAGRSNNSGKPVGLIWQEASTFDRNRADNLRRAATQAVAAFGLSTMHPLVFVRWTFDEDATRSSDLLDAWELLAVWSACYFAAALFVAAWLHWRTAFRGRPTNTTKPESEPLKKRLVLV
eukprot:TRINITY_DN26591_c0_g1_i1.p1 TRINITY_DN26591_c0_g1~~TRINITY_DN26591_c0_g1_i1.p1  ORF type:complete len:392 (+),score=41.02 TRINITY_DN26591_c0_g1_i1:122-1177(+)